MANSTIGIVAKYAAVDIVGSFLYFPFWWYSKGLIRTAAGCVRTVRGYSRRFGVGVWLKNLFVPMFGQYDAAGRIISFFMRLAALLYYSLVLSVISLLMFALFLAWLSLPIVAVTMFVGQAAAFLKTFGP